ncbi:histidinol-phosphatase HisJ family protein [Paenibacillus tarimensis]|uniref:histidinol-phosphatase HisJ family protein n=1 Tax=Paenibacillus tarimensis TaxID=416012 RepID=UPI001F36187C|nr:histidinol-phosphatase HisJ family protein [Paenibacillus tarimensis]MCF2942729.1 histidinol-phosphatase HisJ family protein [Paenibacillus tarimensis]
MKVDMHFHLEEGPYTMQWLGRTIQALQAPLPGSASCQGIAEPTSTGSASPPDRHSLSWMKTELGKLNERLDKGGFSREWLDRYLDWGRARGIERFGIVDHLYRFEEFQSYYANHIILDDSELGRMQRRWLDHVCIGSIHDFLGPVQEAADRLGTISVGLEADYFPEADEELRGLLAPYKVDYVIGSVHFLNGWGFDNPDSQARFKKADLQKLYTDYYTAVEAAVRCGLFDFIGHPDNLKLFGFRPDEEQLMPLYERLARTMQEAGVGSEINTGLAYRYPAAESSPSPVLLQILCQYGVPLTTSSDAHYPDDIGMLLEEAVELARAAGYKELCYYSGRQRIPYPIP